MFMSSNRTAWVGAGMLLSLIVGSPVWADDVELLLSTPASSNAAKPNILFIIDSSGSMRTIESSQEPYDSTRVYNGGCDLDKYYWTTSSNIPNCGRYYNFEKDVFVCQQGTVQASASGSYTDTMSMYRPNSKGRWKWRQMNAYRDENLVECKADSGKHGAGATAESQPYARSGTNAAKYTDNEDLEVSWGTKPTHQIVTVYDSNYLNWYHNPPGSDMRRTDIVKAVTKNVLGSVKDVNVGFMRFHYDQGGPVIHGIKDLDDNRGEANDVVDSIPASGWTPLSETLYEAALYYRGMEGYYGGTTYTDRDALDSWDSDDGYIDYKQPAEYACAKNFIVLLTDGEPTKDTHAYNRVPQLPGFAEGLGRTACTGGNVNGACLDDVAEYLSKVDINPGVPGKQDVTTYTIGFTVDLPILKATAEKSGGEYYLASDVASLTAALTDIVTNIFDRDISFTAPAVAVNAFNRTQHLNDLYVSVFRATDHVHWPGNMKKYTITEDTITDANENPAVDPDTGFFADGSQNFWSRDTKPDGADVNRGGAANALPDPMSRRLYTNITTGDLAVGTNAVSVANIDAFDPADFGLAGAAGEPGLETLIEWVRGVDIKDEDNDPLTFRRYAMGDTLHSQPAAVVYGAADGSQEIVVFAGTNDGYLHAVDASSGEEMWSFIPRELLPNLADLYYNENVDYKNYGIDGDIVPIIYDKHDDGVIVPGEDFVYLVFGMRRGGDNYYLLDVTDRQSPKLKWIRTFPEMGQSWSAPAVAKIKIDGVSNPLDAVLVIGGGYDTSHDSPAYSSLPDAEGAGIFMLSLETGDQVWRAGRDAFADLTLEGMTRAIPGRIRVIDLNSDGLADRMYAADLGGQIWRFDITNENKPHELVAGGIIAQLGAEGHDDPTPADTRRFYTTPDVSMFVDKRLNRRYLAVNIGTGYRAHPLDNSANDRFYSLRDPHVFNALTQAQYNSYPVIRNDDLIEVAGQVGAKVPSDGDGWMLTLPPTQKILSDSRTFDDAVYFVSFEPTANSEDPCQAGLSVNRLYRVNVVNGDPIQQLGSIVDGDSEPGGDGEGEEPAGEDEDVRVIRLDQRGIAPRPEFFFPGPADPDCQGDECKRPPIACVGVECFDPGFDNNPVRTLWTQDSTE